MSVGKCCAQRERCATFTTRGVLWHEAGETVDSVRNHYQLERWIRPGSLLAPVQSGSSGSASEPPGRRATVPQRADAEILVDAHAPRADEEHIEPEILPEASQPSPRESSKNEMEKHDLLHDPAMPWCDICIQSKGRDDVHGRAGPKVRPVIQLLAHIKDSHISTASLGQTGAQAQLGHQLF